MSPRISVVALSLSSAALLQAPILAQGLTSRPARSHFQWVSPPVNPLVPTFGALVDYELSGSEPVEVEVFDFDGDGNLDLCVPGHGDADVSVQWGDGAGGFGDGTDFTVVLSPYDPGPWGVGHGDFDGDGLHDIAVTLGGSYNGLGQSNHKVHLFLNDGDRDFVYSTTVLATGRFPIDCAAADFDEDGKVDLAVISNSAGIDVFPGLGNGTFGAKRTILGSLPQNGIWLKSIDLDQDGYTDLVGTKAGLFAGHTVYWGDGTGWFDSGSGGSSWLAPGYNAAFGDVNLDGHLDVVSSAPDKFPNYTGGLWVMAGQGARSFSKAGQYGSAFTGAVAMGDTNHDGFPDVFGLDGLGIRTYLGYGDGSFFQGPHLPTGLQPTDLALGDWNGDGLDDVASPYRNLGQTPYVSILLNETP